MKTFFLYLILVLDETSYIFHKIDFSYQNKPITCDEAFEKSVIHKEGNTYYKRFLVMGHHCEDLTGNNYIGYQEKLDWQLNERN